MAKIAGMVWRVLTCRSGSRGRRALCAICLGAPALLVIAGCNASTDGPARDAASRFVAAVEAADSERACALLAPDTVESLESLRPEGCQQTLSSLELPHDPVLQVQVWGDAAQARTAGDVLFLRELEIGWRVVAAGCQGEGDDRPYQCALEKS